MKKFMKLSLWGIGIFVGLIVLVLILGMWAVDCDNKDRAEVEKQRAYDLTPEGIVDKVERQAELEREEKAEIRESAYKYFGTKKASSSGLMGCSELIAGEWTIDYGFYPLGIFKYKTELGSNLTTGIKLMYKKYPKIKNFIIRVASPFKDTYGNTTWKEMGSFEFSRALYNQIDWNGFSDGDLLKVAENVKGF